MKRRFPSPDSFTCGSPAGDAARGPVAPRRWRGVGAAALVVVLCAVSGAGEAQAGATAVSAGLRYTCAVLDTGGVKCWGLNFSGQLGDGTTTDRLTPVDVVGLSGGVAAISTGHLHTCAVLDTGGVKCWGSGPLGDGTTTGRLTPVDVVGLSGGVAAISTGGTPNLGVGVFGPSTCALLDAGGVKCWGSNFFGQLGDGTTTDRLTPVDVVGLSGGVAAISAELDHTCALLDTGGVKCWGLNVSGGLGDGTRTDRLTPVDVVGLSGGVAAISAGWVHTCAVLDAGVVKCWGYNFNGQLGDGTTTDRLTPVDVVGLSGGVAAISTGGAHTCAVLDTGGVKCWGYNFSGQLGDGTTTDRLTPVEVVGLSSGVAAISANADHTCAVLDTGGVKCWGYNLNGGLGDGTTTDRLTPVDVVGLSGGDGICGDGDLDADEECDDGDGDPGDGCSAQCTIEPGWTCAGEPSECEPTDSDDDGWPDSRWNHPCSSNEAENCDLNCHCNDNCPTVANPLQDDMDGDGSGDACDEDKDGDGFPEREDGCSVEPGSVDRCCRGGEASVEILDDGTYAGCYDNCPAVANTQSDSDNDGIGNACDPTCVPPDNPTPIDANDDGVPDNCEEGWRIACAAPTVTPGEAANFDLAGLFKELTWEKFKSDGTAAIKAVTKEVVTLIPYTDKMYKLVEFGNLITKFEHPATPDVVVPEYLEDLVGNYARAQIVYKPQTGSDLPGQIAEIRVQFARDARDHFSTGSVYYAVRVWDLDDPTIIYFESGVRKANRPVYRDELHELEWVDDVPIRPRTGKRASSPLSVASGRRSAVTLMARFEEGLDFGAGDPWCAVTGVLGPQPRAVRGQPQSFAVNQEKFIVANQVLTPYIAKWVRNGKDGKQLKKAKHAAWLAFPKYSKEWPCHLKGECDFCVTDRKTCSNTPETVRDMFGDGQFDDLVPDICKKVKDCNGQCIGGHCSQMPEVSCSLSSECNWGGCVRIPLQLCAMHHWNNVELNEVFGTYGPAGLYSCAPAKVSKQGSIWKIKGEIFPKAPWENTCATDMRLSDDPDGGRKKQFERANPIGVHRLFTNIAGFSSIIGNTIYPPPPTIAGLSTQEISDKGLGYCPQRWRDETDSAGCQGW